MAPVVVAVAVVLVLVAVVAQALRPAVEAGLRRLLRLAAELALAGVAAVWSSAREMEPWGLLHLRGRRSFSAAMGRISPPTVQPTYERAPSTRSPLKGRPCPSACRNWMPVRG